MDVRQSFSLKSWVVDVLAGVVRVVVPAQEAMEQQDTSLIDWVYTFLLIYTAKHNILTFCLSR